MHYYIMIMKRFLFWHYWKFVPSPREENLLSMTEEDAKTVAKKLWRARKHFVVLPKTEYSVDVSVKFREIEGD